MEKIKSIQNSSRDEVMEKNDKNLDNATQNHEEDNHLYSDKDIERCAILGYN